MEYNQQYLLSNPYYRQMQNITKDSDYKYELKHEPINNNQQLAYIYEPKKKLKKKIESTEETEEEEVEDSEEEEESDVEEEEEEEDDDDSEEEDENEEEEDEQEEEENENYVEVYKNRSTEVEEGKLKGVAQDIVGVIKGQFSNKIWYGDDDEIDDDNYDEIDEEEARRAQILQIKRQLLSEIEIEKGKKLSTSYELGHSIIHQKYHVTVYNQPGLEKEFAYDGQNNKEIRLQSVTQIFNEKLRQMNMKYVDPEFPPIFDSLIRQHQMEGETPKAKKNKARAKFFGELIWKRAQDLYKGDLKLFNISEEGQYIEPNDIKQGKLGNCYFLSAISALAEYPYRISQLFSVRQLSQEGFYSVKVCDNGEWRDVVVDDYIPANYNVKEKEYKPVFTKGNGNELWVNLIEKVWAKMHYSYCAIISGFATEVLHDFTGAPTMSYKTKRNKEELWNIIYEGNQKGFVFCCGAVGKNYMNTKNKKVEAKTKEGLVLKHAYSLIDCDEEWNTPYGHVRLCRIRNPWGKFEWKGEWNDKDPKWTPYLKKKFNYFEKDDGMFFMSFDDFRKQFGRIDMAFVYDRYIYSSYKFRLADREPGKINLNIYQPGKYFISLNQPNIRDLPTTKKIQFPALRIVLSRKHKNQLIKLGSNNAQKKEVWIETELLEGEYRLTVYCNPKFQRYNLDLTVSTYGVCHTVMVSRDKDFMEKQADDQLNGKNKILSKNNSQNNSKTKSTKQNKNDKKDKKDSKKTKISNDSQDKKDKKKKDKNDKQDSKKKKKSKGSKDSVDSKDNNKKDKKDSKKKKDKQDSIKKKDGKDSKDKKDKDKKKGDKDKIKKDKQDSEKKNKKKEEKKKDKKQDEQKEIKKSKEKKESNKNQLYNQPMSGNYGYNQSNSGYQFPNMNASPYYDKQQYYNDFQDSNSNNNLLDEVNNQQSFSPSKKVRFTDQRENVSQNTQQQTGQYNEIQNQFHYQDQEQLYSQGSQESQESQDSYNNQIQVAQLITQPTRNIYQYQ